MVVVDRKAYGERKRCRSVGRVVCVVAILLTLHGAKRRRKQCLVVADGMELWPKDRFRLALVQSQLSGGCRLSTTLQIEWNAKVIADSISHAVFD